MVDLSRLWVSDWIVIGFFAYLIILARVVPMPGRHRFRVLAVGLVCASLAVMLSQLRLSYSLRLTREWLPAVYLLQGYWLCGLFFQRPMLSLENRLVSTDRTVFRVLRLDALVNRGPRAVLEYFELAYLLAYPFVPLSFGVFCWLGFRSSADQFWVAVLVAGYGAYGCLPWIQTRPPRSVERHRAVCDLPGWLRRLNLTILRHGSVQVNTFPSGHASVAIAAALAVMSASAAVGVPSLILAVSICIGTVLGRYHYTTDTLLGVLVGLLGWWVGFRWMDV